MGVRERQHAVRAMRGQMCSPGRPSTARREDAVGHLNGVAPVVLVPALELSDLRAAFQLNVQLNVLVEARAGEVA